MLWRLMKGGPWLKSWFDFVSHCYKIWIAQQESQALCLNSGNLVSSQYEFEISPYPKLGQRNKVQGQVPKLSTKKGG